MAPKNVFRVVVGLSLALTVASAISDFYPGDIPEGWNSVLLWQGNGSTWESLANGLPENFWGRVVPGILAVALAAYCAAVQIGMFLFWRFARIGFVWLTGLMTITVLLDGLIVMVPVAAALYQLSLIIDGVLIAMAYLQPVASYFEKDA